MMDALDATFRSLSRAVDTLTNLATMRDSPDDVDEYERPGELSERADVVYDTIERFRDRRYQDAMTSACSVLRHVCVPGTLSLLPEIQVLLSGRMDAFSRTGLGGLALYSTELGPEWAELESERKGENHE